MSKRIERRMLNHLHDGSSGIQWLQGLARAGVKRSHGVDAERMYALAQQVHEIDDAIAETFVGEQVFFPLPPGWWMWTPLLYAYGFMWALQYRPDARDPLADLEERLSIFMVFCMALGAISAVVLIIKFVRERRARQHRLRRRPELRAARAARMTELNAVRDAMVGGA